MYYVFIHGCLDITLDGFPHSDIAGSLRAYRSPTRFAVCCVLLQFQVARHPPYALSFLIISFLVCLRVCFLISSNSCEYLSTILLDLLLCLHVIRFSKIDLEKTRSSKTEQETFLFCYLLRKEVIHPHLPVGKPCYDLTPVINPAFDGSLLSVMPPASGIIDSHGLTGGVYKARERIHRSMLICDY